MRKGLWLLGFLFCFGLNAQTNLDSLFTSANGYYKKGQFSVAAINYEKIIEAGKHSCDLYFNLGNAYYKMDSLGLSILSYERALKINPSYDKAKINLAEANQLITQKAGIFPEIFYIAWIKNIIGKLGYISWLILGVLLIWLALGSAYQFINIADKKRKKTALYAALGLTVFSLLFFSFGIYRNQWAKQNNQAIVLSEMVNLKNGPNVNSKNLFKISEGNKITIIQTLEDGWCKIAFPDGQEGWLNESEFERI